MLYNVMSLLFLLLTASAKSLNSFHRQLPSEKPDILLQDPFVSKASDSHISEFTDPDTGLNPFLDLEEGPTFIGRNVMKDENREYIKEISPPFMDYEMVEGDVSNRRLNIELDFPKKPIEETIPIWIPFEDDFDDIKMEDLSPSSPLPTINTDDTTVPLTTEINEEQLLDSKTSDNAEQKIRTNLSVSTFSNIIVLYALASIGILTVILFLSLGSWYWKRKMTRTSRLPTSNPNNELKC